MTVHFYQGDTLVCNHRDDPFHYIPAGRAIPALHGKCINRANGSHGLQSQAALHTLAKDTEMGQRALRQKQDGAAPPVLIRESVR